ncbi:uncharacterized protein [Fopius arisanus]|uniref:Uncharacterized protein isoform X1 n=1 Tax=Fopius arisanus TaxID=64838 RepID=A0A9R1TEB8_9HYME|nr:PREDICTED: uncharacterized protein LOC105269333 isoform X1 [Fopius arisanus]
MASSFILLLLTIVATLSEMKTQNGVIPAVPGQFPFIAIIRYHNGVVAIGALISPNVVLGSAVHTFDMPESIAVQLGCISVYNCFTPLIPAFIDDEYDKHIFVFLKLSVPAEFTDTVQKISIGSAMDYTIPICTYVGLNGYSGQVYSMSVKISHRESCRKKGVPVHAFHLCFEDVTSSIILPDKTLGGSIICGKRLVGMMNMYSVLHKTGPHRMYDLTVA